ncbi:MAG: hypothetical protein AAGB16_07275 [Pseudomonadota bacterium]
MLPVPASLASLLAIVTGGFLLMLGLVFLFAPQRGLAMTKHRAESLPIIMAGRYFFMTLIAVAAAVGGSIKQIGLVFVGLAGVAFFDAATYAHAKTAVAPHVLAGIGALVVAVIALGGRV